MLSAPLLFCGLWIFFMGTALTAPPDKVKEAKGGELNSIADLNNEDAISISFVPWHFKYSGNSKELLNATWIKDHVMAFDEFVQKGVTKKGLTFNIYDEKMREATIALVRLLKGLTSEQFDTIKQWTQETINDDMFEYAWRVASLYANKFHTKKHELPYFFKPNYFVNSEVIYKGFKLKINGDNFKTDDAQINSFYFIEEDDFLRIIINANYSNWNKENVCNQKINYFTEDVGLNSYYYGIHLLHPFWMTNKELDKMNPRHAEHYYFNHKQLINRYNLEKEQFKSANINNDKGCDDIYNPNLVYDNGLPFPIRSNIKGDWNEETTHIKMNEIAVREFMSRGLTIMHNESNSGEEDDNNDNNKLARIIRTNFDGPKTASIIRSIYGYGYNGYPVDMYNPTPSLLHHPQTSLRDPAYWNLITYLLNYFTEYQQNTEAFDLNEFETADLKIVEIMCPEFTTYFDFYQFNINNALGTTKKNNISVAARQRRLRHKPITIAFKVFAKKEQNVSVRVFLGPQCVQEECWNQYSKFYQVTAFNTLLYQGENLVNYSTLASNDFSIDDFYNLEYPVGIAKKNYNIFKFPETLILPKGLEEGLNLTMFIMVTPTKGSKNVETKTNNKMYAEVSKEVDEKPLGFPFHAPVMNVDTIGTNHRFFNVTIYHTKNKVDLGGHFSPHLD